MMIFLYLFLMDYHKGVKMDKITLIIGLTIGIIIGGVLGFTVKWGIDRVKIAELQSQADRDKLARENMKVQWEKAVNELNSTKVLLNDSLAALELLKQYQLIDDRTRQDINKIKDTLDDSGNITADTEDTFRNLIDEFNRLNGNISTESISELELEILDIEQFISLKKEAQKFYNKTIELIIELEIKE
jgi:hypothetical protein